MSRRSRTRRVQTTAPRNTAVPSTPGLKLQAVVVDWEAWLIDHSYFVANPGAKAYIRDALPSELEMGWPSGTRCLVWPMLEGAFGRMFDTPRVN